MRLRVTGNLGELVTYMEAKSQKDARRERVPPKRGFREDFMVNMVFLRESQDVVWWVRKVKGEETPRNERREGKE